MGTLKKYDLVLLCGYSHVDGLLCVRMSRKNFDQRRHLWALPLSTPVGWSQLFSSTRDFADVCLGYHMLQFPSLAYKSRSEPPLLAGIYINMFVYVPLCLYVLHYMYLLVVKMYDHIHYCAFDFVNERIFLEQKKHSKK